jgi:hypothetical protein
MASSSQTSSNKFEYQRLDDGEIRLVSILPASAFNASIECTLQHVSLKNRPRDEAVSYCWGSPETTKSINLMGTGFEVTVNLESALRHFRKHDVERTLWVARLQDPIGHSPPCSDPARLHRQITFHSWTHSNHSPMPYQLRKRSRVTNTEPTSSGAVSGVTLEHTQPTTDRPTLRERTESRRSKRGLRGLSEGGTGEFQLPLARNIVLIRVRIAKRGL